MPNTLTETLAAAEGAYRRALSKELQIVDALGERPTDAAIRRAWAAAEVTNAALRAWNVAREVAS